VRFVIRRNAAGQFWWRAMGDNNKIMAASELMTNKQWCLDAIATVKREATRHAWKTTPHSPAPAVRSELGEERS
jgi:uncharacterized protein YegP (UPF0339 family)